jgi:hypothetical protein
MDVGAVRDKRSTRKLDVRVFTQPGRWSQPVDATLYLKVAKRVALLRHTHRAEPARPGLDILKQVMMDSAVVLKIKLALGQWLSRSRRRVPGFSVMPGLVPGIHVLSSFSLPIKEKTWMAGTSPAMTSRGYWRGLAGIPGGPMTSNGTAT